MKIILVCNSLIGGGAEKVASDTLSILRRNSNVDVLVASSDSESDIKLSSYKSKSIILTFFNFKNFYILLKSLVREKPDAVHIHNYLSDLTSSVVFSVFVYKIFRKLRVIQTLHDHHLTCPNSSLFNDSISTRCMDCIGGSKANILKNKCYKGSFSKSLFKYLRFSFFSSIVRHTSVIDLFLCPSEFIQAVLVKDGFRLEKTKVVKNPLSPALLPYDFIAETENRKRAINIIYLGRLVEIKSIDTLIKAVSMCRKEGLNITVDICGKGYMLGELKALVESFGLVDVVRFRGRINSEEISNLAQSSELIVLPSVVYENAPLVIYEGVFLGLFPIVSNIGGMIEAVDTLGIGLTFEVGSPESLKENILTYVVNRNTYNIDKKKAIKKIRDEMNESIYLDSLLKSYSLD